MPALSGPWRRAALLSCVAAAVFAAVAVLVAAGAFHRPDHGTFDALFLTTPTWGERALRLLVFVASFEGSIGWLAGLAGIAVAAPRLRPLVLLTAVALVAGDALELALKAFLVQPAPPGTTGIGDVSILHVATPYSFPSGHVFRAAVLATATALCLPAIHRRWAVVLAATVVAGVGYSRLALGVHWLSDALGGLALAAAAVPALVVVASGMERAPDDGQAGGVQAPQANRGDWAQALRVD
jgi:membrane-associated phospholipid phosphatase